MPPNQYHWKNSNKIICGFITTTHCRRTDYWLISYLDYDNYKDYDDFDKDYDDNYDDYDGDYDILNLTQHLMQNWHSVLLSSFVTEIEAACRERNSSGHKIH